MRELAIGVDAGGSRTIAVAAYGDEIVRTVEGEGANATVFGVARAADAIARVVESALGEDRAAVVAVGAAGASRQEIAGGLATALTVRFPGARVAVTDDAHIALRGAIPRGDGIAIVAGTGSIAYAEVGGRSFRAGGYGYALGDEGSGYAIGSAALRLLLRSYEGRTPRDPMLDALEERIGSTGAAAVMAYVYAGNTPIASVASFAPVVLDFANAGERSANKIVQTAALDLFDMLRAVCRMSNAAEGTSIAFCGGLLRENSMLTYLLESRIGNEFPHLPVVKGGGAAHLGALAEARALLEVS